jgi:hypothetical protein
MEAALGSDLVRSLRLECSALGVPADRWHRVPAIARPWETVAAVRFAEVVQAKGGAWKDAIDEAALHIGIPPDTIHSRLKRWWSDAYRLAA